jgi:hypothetical protein
MNVEEKRAAILRRMLAAGKPEEEHVMPETKPASPETAAVQGEKGAMPEGKGGMPEEGHAMPEPIAIVGLSGYLPGSMSVQEFWNALDKDASLITAIPESRIRWRDDGTRDDNRGAAKWGGLIPDIRGFDPTFFNILPGEADLMDPRTRLLLMSVYHAIEDAGYAPRSLQESRTGVFVAIEEDEYSQCLREVCNGRRDAFLIHHCESAVLFLRPERAQRGGQYDVFRRRCGDTPGSKGFALRGNNGCGRWRRQSPAACRSLHFSFCLGSDEPDGCGTFFWKGCKGFSAGRRCGQYFPQAAVTGAGR